ncbi:hypothetical protein [Pseudomonas sp. IT-P291]|uniref:hypothetical protein n=1 Tax=Pseudomonas sp. IT-P291 TaxID=3026448 RepID=UPI0039E1C2A8
MRSLAEICLQELSTLVGEMAAKGHEAEALIYAVAKEAGVTKLAHAGRLHIEKAIFIPRCLGTAAGEFLRGGLLDLRLGASFSNHPKHALRCAPNVAIHWK